MSYADIDNFLRDQATPKSIPVGPAAVGFLALKKMARVEMGGAPQRHLTDLEALSTTLAQLVSYSFEKEACGLEAPTAYLLSCLQSLHPDGFIIPDPVMSKTASTDALIAMEQQSISLLEKVCSLVGDHPSGHMFRSIIQNSERSIEKIAAACPTPEEKTMGERNRDRIKRASMAKQAAGSPKAAPPPKAAEPIKVPAPNNDSPEDYVGRERQLQLDQANQELAHTKAQLDQTVQGMQQVQQEGQEAQQQVQELDQQLQETQASADESSQMAQASGQQAVEAEGRAAEHANQKMQLGMRVHQMRQTLAEIAVQDPVSETGASVNDMAAQGAPATPDQIAQEEEAAAMQEQGGAPPAEGAAGGAAGAEEAEQAERAQGEADQQAAQADAAQGGTGGGPAGGAAGAPAGPAGTPAAGPAETGPANGMAPA